MTRRIKTVHVFNTLHSGGLQRVVLQLSGWTHERGVDSILVSAGGALERLVPQGVRWVPKASGGFAREVLQLLRVVRTERADVLHAHQRRDALAAHIVGAITRTPVVEHAHNTLPRTGIKALSFRSERIFAVSRTVRRMVVETYGRPESRVLVVGGVPFNTTAAPPVDRPPLEGRPRRIVAIGRVAEQKDPERFVRAIAAAARTAPIEAHWLGEGPLLERCRALAAELGAPVRFVGDSDRVVEALDAADAFVILSRWEGLGLVVLEAFARRRPVIGVAVGGIAELLADGRGVAVDADAGDDAVADAILRGSGDGAEVGARVDEAARYVAERATPEAVFGPVLDAYRESAGIRG